MKVPISKIGNHNYYFNYHRLLIGLWDNVLCLLWSNSRSNMQKNRRKTLYYLISFIEYISSIVFLWPFSFIWSSSNNRIDVCWNDAYWTFTRPPFSSYNSRNHKIYLRSFENWRITVTMWQGICYLYHYNKSWTHFCTNCWRYIIRLLWIPGHHRHLDDRSFYPVHNILFFGYQAIDLFEKWSKCFQWTSIQVQWSTK